MERWLGDGKKLFRGWSVEYLHGVFERAERWSGVIRVV